MTAEAELRALRAVVARVLRQGGGVAQLREHLNARPVDGSDTTTEWAYVPPWADNDDDLQPCTEQVARLRLADGRRKVYRREVTATPWTEVPTNGARHD